MAPAHSLADSPATTRCRSTSRQRSPTTSRRRRVGVVPRRRRQAGFGAVVGGLAAALLLSSCSGGSTQLTDPHDLPPQRNGPPADVGVCDVVPLAQASAVLDRPLSVVGLEYGPSRVPTFSCLLG